MKIKATIVMMIVFVLSVMVGAVSAQDNRPGRGRFDLVHELTDIVTEATGLTIQEIREQMRDGSTLTAIIEANGGTVDDVVAAAMTAIEARITEAQANGVITEERAAQMLENLEQRVTDFINGEGNFPRGGQFGPRDGENGPRGDRNPRAFRMVQAVAEATGLEAQAVATQVQDGASLANILTDNGVDVNAFIDEQLAIVTERLDEQVTSRQISQAVADARLNLFRVELNERLNRTVETE